MFSEENAKLGVTYPKGFTAAGIKAGIKKSGNLDLALIYTKKEAALAGTFTQNKVAAAPVLYDREVVATGSGHAIIANAGCANACTGEQGMKDAREMAAVTAEALGCKADDVIVGSTGIIGVNLPMEKLTAGIKKIVGELSEDGSDNASRAIMTTDTKQKACSGSLTLGGKEVRFGAICKGSGMIRPNMATMLCYITTDAAITAEMLQKAVSNAVEYSFNMVSVDGDMSTNDSCVCLANGEAGNPLIDSDNDDYKAFAAKLKEICIGMAMRMADDGEGATKLITVNVEGAQNFAEAKKTAMSVAQSPLVKTAFFGEDPNWGRVICAVGYADAPMVPEKTVVSFGDVVVFDKGLGAKFDEEHLRQVMEQHDITVTVELGLGEAEATVWTCDFSYEYVKINGEYHT
ncbi:MAG: bifunctional glutamate N-acetyltransferase/amino-acid acetyltransferase ArgJ [Selenomonadaceae bacterium]|nr:bifunctional glutamate N-acetyltransferase/amino-acid acetyltransferase ArgJ [Selenomonadaceae bacterium]